MDLCQLNPLKCLNNGTCTMNYSSNMTYCLCDECHIGHFCENTLLQKKYDTAYVYLIIYSFWLCISVLNNSMCLELFIKSKSLRRTNCRLYLIIYSIVSLLASILAIADRAVLYDQSVFNGDQYARDRFHCIVGVVGHNSAFGLCIWFIASIQLEHALFLLRDGLTGSYTRRPIVFSLVSVAVVIGCSTPFVFYNCDWANVPHLKMARLFLVAFYICVPGVICILSLWITYLSIVQRIRRYGLGAYPYIGTLLRLCRKHFFIFLPAIVYIVCYVPFNTVTYFKKPGNPYLACGISLSEYIVKVLLVALTGVPLNITWFIFVYPSKVYLTEFYMNTWCGQWTAYIVLLFRRCCSRK